MLEEKGEKKIKKLEDANIDFKKYQNDIFNKENIVSRCEFIYSKQEELLKEISSKVGNISSYESVRYNLSGFGSLLLNGIKLIGLFALSPFKGLFPSISLQTSLTKKTVSNLRKSIASTKKTEIVYTADDYIDKLNELDTTGVEPMSHVFPVTNVFREDVVTNGDGSEATLSNAPSMKDSGFKVPKTIG